MKWKDETGKKEIEKDLAQVILFSFRNNGRMNIMDPISDSNVEFSSCSHTDFNAGTNSTLILILRYNINDIKLLFPYR